MSQEPAPEVQGVPVTALNWQDPPANRWAFWHVGDLLPTYRVSRGDGQARCAAEAEVYGVVLDDRLTVRRTAASRAAPTDGERRTHVPPHELREQPVRLGGCGRRSPADPEAGRQALSRRDAGHGP